MPGNKPAETLHENHRVNSAGSSEARDYSIIELHELESPPPPFFLFQPELRSVPSWELAAAADKLAPNV